MPDRDYYFDEDKADKRTAYKKHIAKMLYLLDNSDKGADDEIDATYASVAEQIYNLEEKLAEAHMTKTENRDPEATYNKMSVEELTKVVCEDKFDFASYFTSATKKTIESLGDINIRNKDALCRAANLIATSDASLLREYLRLRVIRSCAKYLPKVFVDEDFDFNEKTLAGTNEIKPR